MSRLLPVAACAAISLCAMAPMASAQTALPAALITNSAPSPADLNRIREHASEMASLIATGDPREVQGARRAMVRHFVGYQERPSVTFRLNYGRELAKELDPVIAGGDVHRAVNALLAIGPLSIKDTVDLQVRALDDDRSGVRLAAATSLSNVIQGDTTSRDQRDQAIRAIEACASALGDEQDSAVGASLVSSLAVNRAGDPTVLSKAAERLAEEIPSVIANLDDEYDVLTWSQALGKAALTMRDGVQRSTNQPLIRKVTRGSAACMAFADRVLEEQADLAAFEDTPSGMALSDLVTAANAQIKRAEAQLEAGAVGVDFGRALQRAFDDADPAEFTSAISSARPNFEAMGLGSDAFDPSDDR